MRIRQHAGARLVQNAVIAALVVVTVLPLLLMLNNSLKDRVSITRNPLAPPKELFVSNYEKAWVQGRIPSAAFNSMSITAGTIVVTILCASMAAYVFARRSVRGWQGFTIYFLVCNTLPKQLIIIPLFLILQRLKLINNIFAMMFIYGAVFTPFALFLLRTYFMGIDRDYENSAKIDGASMWQIFIHIIFPLVQPGLLTAAVIVGLWCWNEFLFAVTFLQTEEVSTIAVRFYSFIGRYNTEWGNMMAYAAIITVPVMVFFILLQNRFIDGMTAGGIKG
ncbi:MAG: carbohydrate ABC transporter permease [Treponema sp.]|jgi:raffinose/stachyose/melibiose transport system permease protein|nr:carbohydrate ABC transporter permease [Treponema sp.]